MGQMANLLAMWRKPFYVAAGVFSPSVDLSWIMDAPSTTFFAVAHETADGVRTVFTFDLPPKVVFWNGVAYWTPEGFVHLAGPAISFLDEIGIVVAPEAGAHIRAIY
jgi:hypothetical protein